MIKEVFLNFDYIIIGAGSAGCAVANRLSESGLYRVAVVEAGGRDSNPWIHVPVGYFKTMGNSKTDWCYVAQQDSGLNGRAIPWPRGRVLGGSSSINGLLYVRGQPLDFNHWQQLGNAGWGWDDVLPYFKRSETWKGDSTDLELRGGDGPLSVSPTSLKRDVVDKWISAAVAAGYRETQDYNGVDQEGVGYFQLTMNKGKRCSSAVAYLNPARGRENLTIFTHMQVEKVLIEDGRVTGINAKHKGQLVQLNAAREVILSAGAIGSPQILMLSGIGDSSGLGAVGITTKKHLPGVGKNLQDHLQARPIFKTDLSTINTETSNYFKQAIIGLQYVLRKTGPMTMAASLGAGFLKTESWQETPDIQFHIQPFSADNAIEGPHPFSAFTASVLQLRPESVGHLKLVSANIDDHPEIHPNYLEAEIDQRTIVKGIQIARKIAQFEPLKSHITEEYQPGHAVAMDDYDATLNWARNTAVTIYHPTGTCKMGSDPMAVVDHRLRVHGLRGLRVADASIMPVITSGNTNAPAIMIGEKVSDMILEDAAS
jgi:choline dehydrogenase